MMSSKTQNGRAKLWAYMEQMRVWHWVKNCLVFVAPACSGRLFSLDIAMRSLQGFVVFCLVSSAVYVVNDIRDVEKDCTHPRKCMRPIASGRISIRNARILAILLLVAAALCSHSASYSAASLIPAIYLGLNIGYSMGLKDVPLLDIAILAFGFMARVFYGAIMTGIRVSDWLYLTVMAMALYCSMGKRRNELRHMKQGSTRTVLSLYTESFLDKNMYMCFALVNVFYALWSMDARTQEAYGNYLCIWTVPIVLLICMRYSFDVEGDSDGDPVEVIFHDRILLAMCLGYLAVMCAVLYL